ncbi:MAG: 23S rRNA (pseudouridine(1915)-N(3))-methyltransferase RlmH [Crocinitomicaceae bacterium]|nr:23S rRNA (pseudouridine(1915)-N(3))-methyltransferase RlmH [Crocinitomicaceae bacterium]|tara:strand:- start:4828 stop:5301 length:474 start_codon:yes stop_codon:yes gene_type:complete
MKIKLIVVGKTQAKYLIQGENDYSKRISHYTKFEEIIISEVKNGSRYSKKELKIKEGDLILSKLENGDKVILLDDKGKQFSSLGFSNFISNKIMNRTKALVFIVGGAYGFSDEVYNRANSSLSLSKMTFSHQMVRLIFKEQLYRTFTILKGEKYHHE